MADGLALEDDVEREDRRDDNVHEDRGYEELGEPGVFLPGPLHHGDGDAAFHHRGEDNI